MLYQTDRGWPSDAIVEKMLAPLTKEGQDRVRGTYHDVIRFLQNRKDYKGLGHADMAILTFTGCQLNLADRAVLRWILQESCDFTIHMEVTPAPNERVEVIPTCKLELVLMW